MAPPVEKNKLNFSSADHCLISSAKIGENQQQSLGSFVTAFGGRRIVRLATKKKNRTLRKIWICTDVWMDILPFFDRPQLGLKLALLSPRFDVLVEKYFDGKNELTIWRHIIIHKDNGPEAKLSVQIGYKFAKQFPLPARPLPNKIRFNYLTIQYIDHSVLAFLRSNQQIFARGTNLLLYLYSTKIGANTIWDVFVRQIWPFFVTNIRCLYFPNGDYLNNLRRLISPTILTDLNQLKSIEANFLFPDGIGDGFDGPNASAGQALAKWLHTPTKDGQPRRLIYKYFPYHHALRITKWVNTIKEAFLRANVSASYIVLICLTASSPMAQFELVNERTNERLTLMKDESIYEYLVHWLLKRCPIIGETATVNWKDEKSKNLNNVYFNITRSAL